ncbi:hypothetical protein P4H66_18760 [Paenibacillus dokdonensis]|uniref:Uncharacterized protein n=1 Tax=Paenibacillus dokdonensis TaxID=2567944 RepID=A0ABU6GQ50_9BACL|nr:hypothetical protein [Paenibacillus dokdonensis]MEC0241862.1 hypothetical protein [Paenibacillus dokdonensis]
MLFNTEYLQGRDESSHHRPDVYELYSKARNWNDLSQSHMNLAHLLMEEGLCRASLIVGHMAVKAKLKQVYLQSEGMLPLEDICYDELINTIRDFAEINLETELFLNTLQYIAETENATFLPRIDEGHLEKMLERIEGILSCLVVHSVSDAVKIRIEN